MRIIQLPDVLHEYLIDLIQRHSAQGIHPEEGLAIAHLWEAVNRATNVPDVDIQRMAAAATPQGQSTPPQVPLTDANPYAGEPIGARINPAESHKTGKTIMVECQECYDNEGSEACIRPSHQKKK